jgi:hypothetical protein
MAIHEVMYHLLYNNYGLNRRVSEGTLSAINDQSAIIPLKEKYRVSHEETVEGIRVDIDYDTLMSRRMCQDICLDVMPDYEAVKLEKDGRASETITITNEFGSFEFRLPHYITIGTLKRYLLNRLIERN